MDLATAIEEIPKIKIETKIIDDEIICKSLLYSVYYLFKDYSYVVNNLPVNINNIRGIIYDNYISINNGADSIMTFYYLNKKSLDNSDFYKFYSVYLKYLERNKDKLKEYTAINIYHTLIEKIDCFLERGHVYD